MENQTKIQESYWCGACPDCGEHIGDSIQHGDACYNCGHIFWVED